MVKESFGVTSKRARVPADTFGKFDMKCLSDSQFDNLVEDLAMGEFHNDEFNNILTNFDNIYLKNHDNVSVSNHTHKCKQIKLDV